jgi:hypothetical protein
MEEFDYNSLLPPAHETNTFDDWAIQNEGTYMMKLDWLGYDKDHLRAEYDGPGGSAGYNKLLEHLDRFDQARRNSQGFVNKGTYCISGAMRRLITDQGFPDPGGLAKTADQVNRAALNRAFPRLRPPHGYAAAEKLKREFGIKGDPKYAHPIIRHAHPIIRHCLNSRPPILPLGCYHHAGGVAGTMRLWKTISAGARTHGTLGTPASPTVASPLGAAAK